MENKDCIFCKFSSEKIKVKRIYENDNFFSISDANPQTKGHSLVISKKHFETTLDLPSTMGSELLDCIKNTTLFLIKEDKTISGFNIINNNLETAGQVVKHVHFHIIPRRKNDGFKVSG